MSDKDVTLGEVYRAVLGLREEFADTRKEWHDSKQRIMAELGGHGPRIRECEVRVEMLERVPGRIARVAEEVDAVATRVTTLESETRHADPVARIATLIGTALATAMAWFFSR